MSDFLHQIEHRILVGDGGLGTQLRLRLPSNIPCLDACNIDPIFRNFVCEIHEDYGRAGADIIQTNTYGANQLKLDLQGYGNQLESINLAGVQLASQAATEISSSQNRQVFVAGSVGPLETNPLEDELSITEVRQAFTAQMEVLVSAGVDLLILETFTDLRQTKIATKLAVKFGLPVMVQISGISKGVVSDGTDVRVFAQTLSQLGASVIGLNCRGPHDLLLAAEKIARVTDIPLSVQPNAGTPRIDQGKISTTYSVSPDHFSGFIKRFLSLGINVIGGCCGTTSEYISVIRENADGYVPARRQTQIFVFPDNQKSSKSKISPNPIKQIFETNDRIVSVEMRANTFPQLRAMIKVSKNLADLEVDLFDVPDNAGATVNIGAIGTAFKLQQVSNIPTLIHWTTRQRNLISIQSHLLEAWALGIKGVIALSGDHPKVGRFETAKIVTDVRGSVQLMELLKRLNQGTLIDGTSLGEPCDFYVGGGFTITKNLKPQLRHLRRKVERGAKFIYTQPVYDLSTAEDVYQSIKNEGFDTKILLGILPITSLRSISFLQDNLGMYIPSTVVKQFQDIDNPKDQLLYGLSIARDLVSRLSEQNRFSVDGIYIIPPSRMNWANKQVAITQLVQSFRKRKTEER